jgi:hypothetical protein
MFQAVSWCRLDTAASGSNLDGCLEADPASKRAKAHPVRRLGKSAGLRPGPRASSTIPESSFPLMERFRSSSVLMVADRLGTSYGNVTGEVHLLAADLMKGVAGE